MNIQYSTKSLALVVSGVALVLGVNARGEESEQLAARITAAPVFPKQIIWSKMEAADPVESQVLWDQIKNLQAQGAAPGMAALEKYAVDHPVSGWTSSLRYNLADYYLRQGRFTKAIEHWQSVWETSQHSDNANAKALADQSLVSLARLWLRMGLRDRAEVLVKEAGSRPLDQDYLQRQFNGIKADIQIMKARPRAYAQCGAIALKQAGMAEKGVIRDMVKLEEPPPPTGFTLNHLLALSRHLKGSVPAYG